MFVASFLFPSYTIITQLAEFVRPINIFQAQNPSLISFLETTEHLYFTAFPPCHILFQTLLSWTPILTAFLLARWFSSRKVWARLLFLKVEILHFELSFSIFTSKTISSLIPHLKPFLLLFTLKFPYQRASFL